MEVKGEKRGGGLGWKILSGYEHGLYLYIINKMGLIRKFSYVALSKI